VDVLEEGSAHWLVLRIQNMTEDEYFAADECIQELAASWAASTTGPNAK
jgi:hypothetical protein